MLFPNVKAPYPTILASQQVYAFSFSSVSKGCAWLTPPPEGPGEANNAPGLCSHWF
jgi:hypothetical protein